MHLSAALCSGYLSQAVSSGGDFLDVRNMQPLGVSQCKREELLSAGLGKTEQLLASENNTEVHWFPKISQGTKEPGLLPKTIPPSQTLLLQP